MNTPKERWRAACARESLRVHLSLAALVCVGLFFTVFAHV